MEVFGLGIKLQEMGAATVEASLKRLGAELAKTALAVTSVSFAFNKLITETTNAQYATAQLEAVLKSTGGIAGQTASGLTEQAAALQKVSIFGDDAIVEMQSLLLIFTKIRGAVFSDAVPAIVNMATALRTDLTSAAMQVGKALEDPVNGLTALGRAGVKFSEEQKETIKTLVETGRQADAQRIILDKLTVKFGGAAQAARDTLGGSLKALGNAFGDLFELSRDSTGGIVKAINGVTDTLQTLNENFDKVKTTAIVLSGVLVAMISPRLIAALTAYAVQINAAWMAHMAAAAAAGVHNGALVTLIGTAQTLTTAFTALWTAIGGPLGVAIAAIAGFGAYVIHELDAVAAIYDEMDRADRENHELARARIRARAQEQADAAAKRKQEAEDAAKEMTQRRADLAELAHIVDLSDQEMQELVSTHRSLTAQLGVGNLAYSERIRLIKELAATEAAIEEQKRREAQRGPQMDVGGSSVSARSSNAPLKLGDARTLGAPLKLPPLKPLIDEADAEAAKLAYEIRETFQQSIGDALTGGIVGGIEQAVASGNIGQGWKAMTSMLLAGIGDAMIKFGTATKAFSVFMKGIKSALGSLNPETSLAMSLAMIAAGAALKGAARSMFGGQSGGAAISTASYGGSTFGGGGAMPTTQLIFGATSATTAAGMTPRSATNVTIIGPNDPTAQRALQELLTKADTRGRLG